MKREIKKKSTIKGTTESSNFGTILESMDSKIDQVLEGYGALDKKIDTNHKEFCEFRKEVSYKFDTVFDELHLIRNDLKEKVSREEFVLLEKRVLMLERKKING